MYAHRITSASTGTTNEPVTVAEVKTHLRIDSTADDVLLGLYITAARQAAEEITKRALVNTKWELTIDALDADKIALPRPPLSTLSTEVVITYTKSTGDTTTVGTTAYAVEPRNEPGFIRLAYDSEWPSDVQDSEGAVRITYRSGYTTSNPAPEPIKHWIKMRAGAMYENREPLITGVSQTDLNRDFVDGLLDPYRVAITI